MQVAELSVGLLTYYVGTSYLYVLLTDQQGRTKRFRLLSCQRAFPLIDRLVSVIQQPFASASTELAKVFQDFCQAWAESSYPRLSTRTKLGGKCQSRLEKINL
jgi:hypothetical protein